MAKIRCLCENTIDHVYKDFICQHCARTWIYQDNPNGRYYTNLTVSGDYERIWIDKFRSA